MTQDYQEGLLTGLALGADDSPEVDRLTLNQVWDASEARKRADAVTASLQRLEEGLRPGDKVVLPGGRVYLAVDGEEEYLHGLYFELDRGNEGLIPWRMLEPFFKAAVYAPGFEIVSASVEQEGKNLG